MLCIYNLCDFERWQNICLPASFCIITYYQSLLRNRSNKRRSGGKQDRQLIAVGQTGWACAGKTGSLSSRPASQGHSIENSTSLSSNYIFVLTFLSNYGHIWYRFQDIARYCPKIAIFSEPRLMGNICKNRVGNQSVGTSGDGYDPWNPCKSLMYTQCIVQAASSRMRTDESGCLWETGDLLRDKRVI